MRFFLLAALTLVVIFSSGCKTDDSLTERPWNAPKSWETGLPSQMNEGR
ncbi:MAG: hypothetical protein ACKO3H_11200 [Verrucomicrobiota bacterium]